MTSANVRNSRGAGAHSAFSLPEAMVSITLFALLMGSIVTANLFGIRWFQTIQTKLLAADMARKSVGHLSDEVRCCSSVFVGNVTNGIFGACTNGQLQQGTSLLIYPSTNLTNYTLYFYNGTDQTFRRVATSTGNTTILASTVTNANIFQMQDYLGNVLSNVQNNALIHCTLQFYTSASNNPTASFYKIETSATPRLLQ